MWKLGHEYQGEWKNDEMEGKGVNKYPNGDKYEGDGLNSQKEGFGTYYYNDQDIY